MFDIHCPRHGTRVLLGSRSIELVNTAHGVIVRWRCFCGETGAELLGRPHNPISRPTAA